MALLENHERYEPVQELGAGTFGTVLMALDRQTEEYVAIKFMERGAKINKVVKREIMAHSKLRHPHVVRYRTSFLTPTHLAIVLDLVKGGTLYDYCCAHPNIPEKDARRFMQQIAAAVDYFHAMGVYNRDIKLENTLFDARRGIVKLTDFGYAKTRDDSRPKTKCGTPTYAAPEVLGGTPGGYDGTKADIWSLGVLLYVMLFHSYPFERPTDANHSDGARLATTRSLNADYIIPPFPPISAECRNFIDMGLQKDPSDRAKMNDIYAHPWFSMSLPEALTMTDYWVANSPDTSYLEPTIDFLISEGAKEPGRHHR